MGAHNMDGWSGAFSFYTLLVIGYGGNVLLIRKSKKSYWLVIVFAIRWFVIMVIFFSLFVYFYPSQSIESRHVDEDLLSYGAAFLSVLFVLELSLYSCALPKFQRSLFGNSASNYEEDSGVSDTLSARNFFRCTA